MYIIGIGEERPGRRRTEGGSGAIFCWGAWKEKVTKGWEKESETKVHRKEGIEEAGENGTRKPHNQKAAGNNQWRSSVESLDTEINNREEGET